MRRVFLRRLTALISGRQRVKSGVKGPPSAGGIERRVPADLAEAALLSGVLATPHPVSSPPSSLSTKTPPSQKQTRRGRARAADFLWRPVSGFVCVFASGLCVGLRADLRGESRKFVPGKIPGPSCELFTRAYWLITLRLLLLCLSLLPELRSLSIYGVRKPPCCWVNHRLRRRFRLTIPAWINGHFLARSKGYQRLQNASDVLSRRSCLLIASKNPQSPLPSRSGLYGVPAAHYQPSTPQPFFLLRPPTDRSLKESLRTLSRPRLKPRPPVATLPFRTSSRPY
ncbi:hypothetical protein BXZ70DRAFT_951943 [Cristinia sonorae]|uniref:Uncharacterized protein n=1 Tax=Cristinia sonorae TaxID=1940300 RepID=A0A8K0XLT2_9AGAR|nr:hypothetical protein BXZ70DRAFT_951943 [Cristinia sonorae]